MGVAGRRDPARGRIFVRARLDCVRDAGGDGAAGAGPRARAVADGAVPLRKMRSLRRAAPPDLVAVARGPGHPADVPLRRLWRRARVRRRARTILRIPDHALITITSQPPSPGATAQPLASVTPIWPCESAKNTVGWYESSVPSTLTVTVADPPRAPAINRRSQRPHSDTIMASP